MSIYGFENFAFFMCTNICIGNFLATMSCIKSELLKHCFSSDGFSGFSMT